VDASYEMGLKIRDENRPSVQSSCDKLGTSELDFGLGVPAYNQRDGFFCDEAGMKSCR